METIIVILILTQYTITITLRSPSNKAGVITEATCWSHLVTGNQYLNDNGNTCVTKVSSTVLSRKIQQILIRLYTHARVEVLEAGLV